LLKYVSQCIEEDTVIEDPNEWFEPPLVTHLYSVGVDIAKVEDFTVICVMDRMTHRLVGFFRINNVSWDLMREKVKEISQKYNDALITLDATGNAGDMFTENLAEIGVNVDTEFVYTGKKKTLLIDKMSMMMQRDEDKGRISFPRIPELIHELRAFTYSITPSKAIKYGSSRQDDCVNSLALACWPLSDQPIGAMSADGNEFVSKRKSYS